VAQLGFLVLLKLFQRLGRPLLVSNAPRALVEHGYDRSGTRRRHLVIIRDHLNVRPYGPAARHAMVRALGEAGSTKHELEDLINVAVEQKVRHFAQEARALDAARMQALEPYKRMTLAVALLSTQSARALDDLGDMFIRRMQNIHNAAKLALDRYRAATVERTDSLVTTLHDLLLAHEADGSIEERLSVMEAVIGLRGDELLEACEAHLVHAGSNYFPFVWRAYKSHRATLFGLFEVLPLRPTSQDTTVEEALRFLQEHAGRTGHWLPMTRTERRGGDTSQTPLLDLSWVPDGWWRLLAGAYSQVP
jgi:hypothetical protein